MVLNCEHGKINLVMHSFRERHIMCIIIYCNERYVTTCLSFVHSQTVHLTIVSNYFY